MGRKQFPLNAKLFQISKALLSRSVTNLRLFQVFYVHTQAERAGGGSVYGTCIWTLQPSSRMGVWSSAMPTWQLCGEGAADRYRLGNLSLGIWL